MQQHRAEPRLRPLEAWALWPRWWDSGMSSWLTTKSMAPATKFGARGEGLLRHCLDVWRRKELPSVAVKDAGCQGKVQHVLIQMAADGHALEDDRCFSAGLAMLVGTIGGGQGLEYIG